ncbi:MAG TPA: hypothetical protein VFB32_09800 [Rudaea sp.]|nr:hypothetical protein [Rudaea sp.]
MKILLPALIAATLACAPQARAGNLVDIGVFDRDTGATLPTYSHDGKLFVAGTPGHRYAVRITNHTGARVLTVLSVDGVNAITGETANTNESGYVLDAYQSTEIEGWRKNMSEIAEFNFTSLGDSYAARTGRPANVGVIGVAVFREKQRPVWRERDEKIAAQPVPPSAAAADSAAPASAPAGATAQAERKSAESATETARANSLAGARPVPKPEESLGTGHGAREASFASYTTFERAGSRPDEVDSIWYDSYRNLVARGVVPQPVPREPQAFPNPFVPDPAR